MRVAICFSALILLVGCSVKLDRSIVESNVDFLNEYSEIVEDNSIFRDSVEVDKLKSWAYEEARKSKYLNHRYDIAYRIFSKMGDEHSFIMSPHEISWFYEENGQEDFVDNFAFEGKVLSSNVPYVKMYGAMHATNEDAVQYADSLQSLISSMDNENCKGWILDLRENEGGDFASMLLATGSLLGNDTCIYLLDNKGNKEAWYYNNGHIGIDTNVGTYSVKPYEMLHPEKPIAILVGPNTASAGEALIVAFSGRANVKIFGKETSGLTSGTQMFVLKNGAIINLATSLYVSRTGKIFRGRIQPDCYVDFSQGAIGTTRDSVIIYAEQWINEYSKK